MQTFDFGDKVRHKTNNNYNAHQMEVKDTDENRILCVYSDHIDKSTKEKWFEVNEVELIEKAKGEFF